MHATQVDVPTDPSPLPELRQPTSICRPISTPEYYHACVGTCPFTHEHPREVILVLRGVGWIEPERWQQAIDRVVAVHPALRLRLAGKRLKAMLRSDGPPPRLRVLEHCDWEASSYNGADFLQQEPLPLETGPTVELIIARQSGDRSMLVLRGHHTIIDGSGALLLLKELFRTLRGEPLLGSNATFSDTDLCRWLGKPTQMQWPFRTMWLTGDCQKGEKGEELRRISLPSSTFNLMPRIAAAFAGFAHRYSDKPASLAIPVDLRRHVPGLLSTMNYVNMIRVRMEKGDGPDVFKARLQSLLSQNEDINSLFELDWFKALPMPWVDFWVSRNALNYRRRRANETAVISYIGHSYPPHFSAPGFETTDMVIMPQRATAFATICKFGKRVEMMLNLPKVLAGDGRFDALQEHLLRELASR